MKTSIYKIINIDLSKQYQFILGKNLIFDIANHINLKTNQKVLIVSDEVVWSIYGMMVDASFSNFKNNVFTHILKPGEVEKNYKNLFDILNKLGKNGFSKTDLILSIGGGVIGDISGLASGLYQRGIYHVMVATTVLSAVDSSVGGKTAINLDCGKNMVGMINQPNRVICDISVFNTLSDRLFYEGIVESIKYAMIYDPSMLELFNNDVRNPKYIYQIIDRSVTSKYNIVKMDEYDDGIRKILNFGHTLGHAIEILSGFNLRHGEAVGIGMLIMTKLSEKLGYLKNGFDREGKINRLLNGKMPGEYLKSLLNKYGLPTELSYGIGDLMQYISVDKKIREDYISLILLENLGKARIENIAKDELEVFLNEIKY